MSERGENYFRYYVTFSFDNCGQCTFCSDIVEMPAPIKSVRDIEELKRYIINNFMSDPPSEAFIFSWQLLG